MRSHGFQLFPCLVLMASDLAEPIFVGHETVSQMKTWMASTLADKAHKAQSEARYVGTRSMGNLDGRVRFK